MHRSPLVTGLAVVFGGTAALFLVFGVLVNPVFLAVAGLFGAVAYLTWYHASGRLAARIYRSVERQAAAGAGTPREESQRGGFGAGPREEWRPPRDGERPGEVAGERVRGGRRRRAGGPSTDGRQRVNPRETPEGPKPADYRILGVEPGADESAITSAYRRKVKEVHPDTEDGDEQEFKRVKAAYERLAGEG